MKLLRIVIVLLAMCFVSVPPAHAETIDPLIEVLSPLPGETIRDTMPRIEATYFDESGIDAGSATIIIDGTDVTLWDFTTITPYTIAYDVPELMEFEGGTHNVTVSVADVNGNRVTKSWTFIVDTGTGGGDEGGGIDILALVMYVALAVTLGLIGLGIYILYLKYTRNFTFRKYFAQHPMQRQYLVIYIPLIIAFFLVVFGFALVSNNPDADPFSYEYIAIGGLFLGLIAYTIDAQREKNTVAKYERAFAQFLFELADAMRGGLNPTKAVIELEKNETGILKPHLQKASENIRIGKPFDDVMVTMGKPMGSALVTRYAELVGDASKIGGDMAPVIHRAAKDIDDFIKINAERKRQLAMQATTVYISFAVFLIIVYQLIDIYPSLTSVDMSLLSSGGDLEGAGGASVPGGGGMDLVTLKRRFLHLMIVNSLGAGMLIGLVIEGKVKYGLLHALAMTLVAVLFFVALIL